VELTGNQWLICIGAALPIVVASEIRKLLLRRRDSAAEEPLPQGR
jgi:P-type Ca2+ transporter type 2C